MRGETRSTVGLASPHIVSVVPAGEVHIRVRHLIFRPVLAALAATFVVRLPTAAQTHIDVVPYVGLYVPTASMVSGDSFGIPPVTQQATFALGARVTVWLPSGLGIESTFGYAPSSVNSAATYDCCNTAHVLIASNRVLVPVVVGGPVSLRLGGGLGLVAHGGRAYIHTGGASALAGVASGGLAIKLYGSRLTLRFDAEDYVFKPGLSAQPGCDRGGYTGVCGHIMRLTGYRSPLQNDLVLSAGLALSPGGH